MSRHPIRSVALPAILALAAGLLILAQRGAADPPAGQPANQALSPGETAIERALAQPASLHFKEVPLEEVATRIARDYKIAVLLDHKSFAAAGPSESTQISFDLDGAPLGAALRIMLKKQELGFVVPDDDEATLLITTEESARQRMITRVFDLHLLAPPPHGFIDRPFDGSELADVVTKGIAPASWDTVGGPGAIKSFGGSLVSTQTEEVQAQVAGLFATLAKVRRQQETKPGGAPIRIGSQEDERIRRKLETPVDFHFDKTPLSFVAEWLGQQGIDAIIDHPAIAQARATDDDPVSLEASHLPLGQGLTRLLAEKRLQWVVDSGVLLIVSHDAAAERMECVVYPVGDLLAAQSAVSRTDAEEAIDTLKKTITTTVARGTWEGDKDGGLLTAVPAAQALVCSHTAEVQDEIGRLLTKLRAHAPPAAAKPGTHAGSSIEKNAPLVKVYKLAPSDDGLALAEKSAEAVKKLIGPEAWKQQEFFIYAFPGRIVVRQTPEVQSKIKSLLDDIGATPQDASASGAAAAGGGGRPAISRGGLRGGGFGGGGGGAF